MPDVEELDPEVGEDTDAELEAAERDLAEATSALSSSRQTKLLLYAIGAVAVIAVLAVWQDLLTVIAVGITPGAIYAMIGLGLALIYKASKVFNFAQGEFGTVPIFVSWLILSAGAEDATGAVRDAGVGRLIIATLIALAAGVLLAMATYVLVVRRLQARGAVTTLVGTAGVALLVVQTEIIIGEASVRNFRKFVNGSPCFGSEVINDVEVCTSPLTIGAAVIEWQTLITLGVLVVTALGLAAFFRTQLGTALLATSQEPFAASLYGISTNTMNLVTWAAAGLLGAIGGLLAAGFTDTFTPGAITSAWLIGAFAGSILGGITSMPGAVVGGLLLGVIQSASNTWLPSSWPGRPQIGVFGVLLIVLLLRPRGLLGKEA